jgi:DNA topoisomerase-1
MTIDGPRSARAARLVYVSDDSPGISRRRAGRGFVYLDGSGRRVSAEATLARIRALAVPPAWTRVWICPNAMGHLQATGRDARGRKQYLYHDGWRSLRDRLKFDHVLDLAERLPAIRERVARDLRRRGLSRDTVVALVVWLLEHTLIRVGNDEYMRENGSFGLTTLRARHVTVSGDSIRFRFRGKSGAHHDVTVVDATVARLVRRCLAVPGNGPVFRYLDESGEPHAVDSQAVNEYLGRASGEDFTAKDFRTWHGTVLAAWALKDVGPPESKTRARKQVAAAVEQVAGELRNTPAVCRACYIHPGLIAAYEDGSLASMRRGPGRGNGTGLTPEEASVLRFLRGRATGARRAA